MQWRQRTPGNSNNMSNRNSLFQNGRGGASSGGARNDRQTTFSEETQRLYEEQNNREIDLLGDKIASLRDIALDIGREVNSQNSLLEGMDGQMGNVGQLMSGALKKLDEMIGSGGSKHMCYLVLLIVAVFLVLYLLLSWR